MNSQVGLAAMPRNPTQAASKNHVGLRFANPTYIDRIPASTLRE